MIYLRRKLLAATVAAILLFLSFTIYAMQKEPSSREQQRNAPKARRVTVHLLKPASEVTGFVIPPNVLAGARPKFFQISEPSLVLVTLPDGKQVSLPVKTALVNVELDVKTKDAVVVDVILLPLMKSVSYKDAVAELHRLMKNIDITPDERMLKRMKGWPDDSPGFDPVKLPGYAPGTYRASTRLSEDAALEVILRAAGDGGWFLNLTFAATGKAREVLWMKPSPEPNDAGAGKPKAQ